MENEQQQTKSKIIENRAYQTKGDHKFADRFDIPPSRMVNHFIIHVIGSNGHFGEVGHQISEQNLFWKQWKKGDKERNTRHAKHISKICTRGHKYIFQRIGKGCPTFSYPFDQNTKIL